MKHGISFLFVFSMVMFVQSIYAQEVRFGAERFTSIDYVSFEKVRLTFDVRPRQLIAIKDFDAYMAAASVHFGLDGQNDRVITSARLEWGGLPSIYLAESAFIDLHLPSIAVIEQKGSNLLIAISGGDAGSAYRASIEIAPYGVISRRVHNRISGHEQITTYFYPPSIVDARIGELKKIREKKIPK
jgi:hypothetical protein